MREPEQVPAGHGSTWGVESPWQAQPAPAPQVAWLQVYLVPVYFAPDPPPTIERFTSDGDYVLCEHP